MTTTKTKPLTVAFVLTMPGRGSWNGTWSGDGQLYAKVERVTRKAAIERARAAVERGRFDYVWKDGWRASVEVREVSPAEARRLRRDSKGFGGYDWMVTSILKHGEIRAD